MPNIPIYTDAVDPRWADWSFALKDLAYPTTVHGGSFAISLDLDGYSALRLYYLNGQDAQTPNYVGLDTAGIDALRFWIHRGNSVGGQTVYIRAGDSDVGQEWMHAVPIKVPTDNAWHLITIPLRNLDMEAGELSQIAWQGDGSTVNAIILDDMDFQAATAAHVVNRLPMVDNAHVLWLYRDARKSTVSTSWNAEIHQQSIYRSTGPYGLAVRFSYYGGIVFRPLGYDYNAPEAFPLQNQTVLRFLLNRQPDTSGQAYMVFAFDANGTELRKRPLTDFLQNGAIDNNLPTWQLVTIPLTSLQPDDGLTYPIHGVCIQEFTGIQGQTKWLYLDEIRFERAIVEAAASSAIYDDALGQGWADNSWSTTVNLNSAAPVQSGTKAISATSTAAWAGLKLYRGQSVSTAGQNVLRFSVYGVAPVVPMRAFFEDANGVLLESSAYTFTPVAGQWTSYEVPLASLGGPSYIKGIIIQDFSGSGGHTYHVDNVSLANVYIPPPPPEPGPALTVNAVTVVRPISPDIYGMNFADENLAAAIDLPCRRWGGDGTTRYNYILDTASHSHNWYFENIPKTVTNPALLPDGSNHNQFIDQDRRTGTATITTMPLMGWTPKSRDYSWGFSIAKYGAQQGADPWRPDAGNGIKPDGTYITGNDPADTSVVITPAFVSQWMQYLVGKYGTAAAGGVRFVNLDNEPMLWNSTHRDVHPAGTSYDELRDKTYAYGAAIKAVDPTVKTLGPVLWGWSAYFFSGKDKSDGGPNWFNNPPDRLAHGNTPFIEWYLQQMKAYQTANGVRILDYMDLHYYPQVPSIFNPAAGGSDTQAKRLRSTRSLWDPTYIESTDGSWINEAVKLVPRMRDWVSTHYPGTKLAITEYNWGALNHINGALAQADILGIFGREGLDLATLWDPPTINQPGAFTFRMYRNYDGNKSRFGDKSVGATTADYSKLSIYAARRTADGALTIIVVNKTSSTLSSALGVTGAGAGSVKVYQYAGAAPAAIETKANVALAGGSMTMDFAPLSITMLVVPSSALATAQGGSTTAPTSTDPQWPPNAKVSTEPPAGAGA